MHTAGSDHAFARELDYESIVARSERVAWTVSDVFRGRRFDASGSVAPPSWLGTTLPSFLEPSDRRTLNHGRAFSYAHLIGNFEEFVPAHLADVAGHGWHVDRAHLRTLFRFGEEEMKHQQLFRRAERVLEESCGHAFAGHFDEAKVRVTQLTDTMLSFPALPRFLILLALECGTQAHYVESVRHRAADGDPLHADILKAHWLEEAQHVKADTLEIARLAGEMDASGIRAALADLHAIGTMIDSVIAGQAAAEVETTERVRGRRFSAAERVALRDHLQASLRHVIVGSGLAHPGFERVVRELRARAGGPS